MESEAENWFYLDTNEFLMITLKVINTARFSILKNTTYLFTKQCYKVHSSVFPKTF